MSGKAKAKSEPAGPKAIENRRSRHDYEFVETFEAGIALVGSEVKCLYLGRANLTDAYCKVENGELWLHEFDIEPYKFSTAYSPPRRRERKLLMHRKEIDTLERKVQEKGLALIPFKVYFKNGRAKVALALARGKRQYDKRKQIADREQRREVERLQGRRK